MLFSTLRIYPISGKVTESSNEDIRTLSRTQNPSSVQTKSPQMCFLDNEIISSNNLRIYPEKSQFQHNASITYSCLPGYLLQKPLKRVVFVNQCVNGRWRWSSRTVPVCRASCREWNLKTQKWQEVRITEEKGDTGYILSPDYPGNIRRIEHNCTFTFAVNNSRIRLQANSINLINYFINISSDNGEAVWPRDNDTNSFYEISGLKNAIVTFKRKLIFINSFGKAENFKLMYKIVKVICKTYVMSNMITLNTTFVDNNILYQQFSCSYPYTLIGPSMRKCLERVWHPSVSPLCDFLCDFSTTIYINNSLNIKVNIQRIAKCRIHLIASSGQRLIKIRFQKHSENEVKLCLNIKSEKINVECAIADARYYFVTSPAYLTNADTFLSSTDTDLFEIRIETVPPLYCSSIPFSIFKGKFNYENNTVFSWGEVRCLQNYYWLGSSKISCILTENGEAKWDFGPRKDCIKVCSDKTEHITISTNPLTLPLPLFLHTNYTAGQICKWKIMSHYFNPIIEITSIEDLRNFANISVLSQIQGEYSKIFIKQKIFTDEKTLKIIFICPNRICIISIQPITPLTMVLNRLFAKVIVKLDDNEVQQESTQIVWVIISLVLILLVPIPIILFIDYWRHPYTGYMAKLLNQFKGSKLKKLSSRFIFEIRPCKNPSKTQMDIIIFYNRYHPDNRAICIRRSFTSIEPDKGSSPSWKYRFSSVRRRFSDITDHVLFSCTLRSSNIRVDQIPPNEEETVPEPKEQ